MTKYLVLYKASASAGEQMAGATPEQMRAGMEAWMTWRESAGNAVVDFGSPVAGAGQVGSGGDEIGGFSILQADSRDDVLALLGDHPHLHTPGGASIEVLEFLPMPGAE